MNCVRLMGLCFLYAGALACGAKDGSSGHATSSTRPGQNANSNAAVGSNASYLRLDSSGNDVLVAPRVHLVSFSGSPNSAALNQSLQDLVGSAAWQAQVAEYGVGDLTVASVINDTQNFSAHVTTKNANGSPNDDVEALMVNRLGSNAAWGSFSSQDVYIVALPVGVAASATAHAPQSACEGNVLAWHSAAVVSGANAMVPYIVLPSCPAIPNIDSDQTRALILHQALIETVTNPRQSGFGTLSASSAGWLVASEAPEAAAMCVAALFGNPNYTVTHASGAGLIPRTWSNQAAKSTNAPCVPWASENEPYLEAQPVLSDAVTATLPSGDAAAGLGVSLAAGQTTQIALKMITNRPDLGAWSVAVQELGTADLTLSMAEAQGSAGDTLTLGVEMANAPASSQQLVRIISQRGTSIFNQYMLIRVQGT